MLRKYIVVVFLYLIIISNIKADGFGNIILLDGRWANTLINVSYTLEKNNGTVINGFSDFDGWIRFNETISETIFLTLDFNIHWDWSEEFDEDFIEDLYFEHGFNILDVNVDRFTRKVEIELNGTEKYILVISLPIRRLR